MLATTAYDSPDASYTFSIARSREALTAAGFRSAYLLLQGNCHVDDARNAVVRDFLASDCLALVFLDADVSWEPESLVALCRLERDIVGGVYPYRRESENEAMPYRPLPQTAVDADGLIEVEGLPTGFMKIARHVIETMAATAKHFVKDEGPAYPVLFERDYFGGGRRGGDIRFCMIWREMGGKVFAAPELRLGHCGKMVLRDSLGASLRRQNGSWARWFVKAIRDRTDTDATYREAFKAYDNKWAAAPETVQIVTNLARSATGPIIEVGSGLSTVAMAAATGQKIWCIEHLPRYAEDTETLAAQAGVGNIALITADLKGGWYDLDGVTLPQSFALGVVDGPPRDGGDRMGFFDALADRCRVIVCDDADGKTYAAKLRAWAASRNRPIQIDGRVAVIMPVEGA